MKKHRKFRLKKDIRDAKAGSIFTECDFEFFGNGLALQHDNITCKNNPDWFEEITKDVSRKENNL